MKETEKKASGTHGYATEEALRGYFLSLGYFAVRGVPFRAYGDDVTDIDVWLYSRHSPVSRERTNVDVKHKQRSRSMERILVAMGIRDALQFEGCIVATTDNRPAVERFGRDNRVTVLGGKFLSQLQATTPLPVGRLSDEDLARSFHFDGMGKITGNWGDRLQQSKSRLVNGLGFDACNFYLEELRFFWDLASANPQRRNVAKRLALLNASYFLISLDFAMARHAFAPVDDRRAALFDGFQFGSQGRDRFEQVAALASKVGALVTGRTQHQLHSGMMEILSSSGDAHFDLAEVFSKPQVANSLVEIARELEHIAYSSAATPATPLTTEARASLGALADHVGVQRTDVL